ncbi:MAG TPA: YwiC-like family protein [Anaerolineales bacterium]|nr:YwiC-like family protein [Anaerolineales bacterium]
MQTFFRKQIMLPQDHGSWVFLLSPLIIGLITGRTFSWTSLALTVAALFSFLLRQPVTMAVKAYSGRRPRTDLPAASLWIAIYGLILLIAVGKLVIDGFGFVLWLAAPGLPIFSWHLWLVSRREERRQAGVEILATGVLALSAPAALWIGIGHYDSNGWWLWLLTWLQSSASIVYAYLRLEQREQASAWSRRESWKKGRRALIYTSFNLFFTLVLSWIGWLPRFVFLAFLIQWVETLWGITHPAAGWKPVRIGTRQLIVSCLWTILFIVFWKV